MFYPETAKIGKIFVVFRFINFIICFMHYSSCTCITEDGLYFLLQCNSESPMPSGKLQDKAMKNIKAFSEEKCTSWERPFEIWNHTFIAFV